MNGPLFTQEHKSVRTEWLVNRWFRFLGMPLVGALLVAILPEWPFSFKICSIEVTDLAHSFTGTLVKKAFAEGISFAILYWCAYRRAGTKLLLLSLLFAPLTWLGLLIVYVQMILYGLWAIPLFLLVVVHIPYEAWSFSVTLRLRRLNMRASLQESKA
ncbi:MAG: hypothetical protein AB7F31_05445 [Parachlamydiales bacterium]